MSLSDLSEVFSYTAFVHAVSGATGGSIAMTTFYPLDQIRTFQQINPKGSIIKLVREEGIEVLYRGLKATLISLYASNFVYFCSNNLLKVLLRRYTGKKEISVVQNLIIASLAGVVNVLTTCPLWVANTRLKLQSKRGNDVKHRYDGLFDCLQKMIKEEGIETLWSGVWASLMLVSNPTINHVAYDSVIGVLLRRALVAGRKSLTPFEYFLAGAIAKAIATIFTYPIQLAQSRQRSGHSSHGASIKPGEQSAAKTNILTVLYKVYESDGILGIFSGIEAKLLQTVLTAAFHFMCYEQIKNIIFSILGPKREIKS